MDERSFQRLLRRTVLVPVVLLVLLAATLVIEILSLTRSLAWVDHTDQVISTTRQVARFMVDMEAGVRGYHLTNDPSFLKPYQEAKVLLPERLSALEQLTADNPEQQDSVRQLRDLDLRWMQWAEQQLNEHGGSTPSVENLKSGEQLMNQIRNQQRVIINEEEELRSTRSHRASLLGRVVVGTAAGLSLLTAFLLFTLTRRELYALSSTYEKHLKAEEEKAQQLEESRERFQTTLNSIGDAVISTNATGKVSFLNPAAEQITGWKLEAAQGRPLREVLHIVDETTRSELEDPIARVRRERRMLQMVDGHLLLDGTGGEHPIELTASPIRTERGELRGVVFVFRDVAQRRQTEQTLRANERLAMAGRLSATIAHEIRNPLDTVSNLVYLLQNEQNPNPTAAQYLGMASDELSRIAQITSQLLTFHREARAPTQVSLVDVLESVLVLFAPQVRKAHIHVEQRFETERTVRGFPGELRQVFSNLVGNAIDVLPKGGKLVLHIRESTLSGDAPRQGIRVTVLDSGPGIPPGVRKNLFAPFYTTKGEKGTGLGLWVSRGIVEKHEGTISLRSSVREGHSGTAFSVFLPYEQELGMLDVADTPPVM